jgi:reductive dehalogenase
MSEGINRRDFVKVGIASGGLIAAGGAVLNHNPSERPWWIETVDKPVLAIDYNKYKRFDPGKDVLRAFGKYVGPEQLKKIEKKKDQFMEKCRKENIPGYSIEDQAMADAGWRLRSTGSTNKGMRTWLSPPISEKNQSPKEKWEGTPEDAAKIIKQAARFFGAASVGITPLNRQYIFTQCYGKEIQFENTDTPDEVDGKKLIIPEKCTYVIALTIRMSLQNASLAPSRVCDATTSLGYSRADFLVGLLAQFIKNLGYIAIPSVNDIGPSIAFAVEAGLGEVGRTNRLITPDFGPAVQLAKVITDLPMATDKPIHFGIKEFCTVCKRCAETCPSKALSFKDEPDFKIEGEWNNPGHQTWFEDSVKCFRYWEESNSYCSTCIMVCPWNKQDKTIIHSIVKAASAKIPVLDNFFVSMDKTFGYGEQKDPKKWWSLDIQEHGLDRTQGKG